MEPDLDIKRLVALVDPRRRAVREPIHDSLAVGSVPSDLVAFLGGALNLTELSKGEKFEGDIGIASVDDLGDVVDEGEGAEEGVPETLDAGVAEVDGVHCAHEAHVVGRAVSRTVEVVECWVDAMEVLLEGESVERQS